MDERYNVGSLIEELSYGKQFEAEDSLIQRPVQIFRFERPSGNATEWQETFGHLSSELATIAHPGLPIIYDHGVDDEGPYLIRQLQESTDINHHLVQNGAFSEYEGWELAHQLLEIFDAARTSGNFHGALDPMHVRFMSRPSGAKRFTITDYGLAEIYNQINGSSDFLGAPYLISPEQAKGEKANEASQVYAIGQLIFHALSGGHPWLETPIDEVKQFVLENPLGPIIDYNPSVPEGFSNWLQQMTAVDPAERFSSYEEATQHLPQPIQSAPVPISASTATVAQSVAAARVVTSTQAIHPAEQHITTAAEDFAAKKAAEDEVKKQEIAQKISIIKNPMVLGGIGVVLILLIVVIAMSGGDDDSSNTVAVPVIEESPVSIPQLGLVSFMDFNNGSVQDPKNDDFSLEALKNRPSFSNNGLSGKALVIDRSHYFRLPIAGTPLADRSKDFTISFWMKSGSSHSSKLAMISRKPWKRGSNEPFEGNDQFWQWTPDNNTSLQTSSWSMVTVVFTTYDKSISLYLNGNSMGNSSNDSQTVNSHIYIGCDSNENFLHKTPMVIDDLAIWDRSLNQNEIEKMYEASISYN
ncbi:LamG-like jellyroll fold domain-containing protein [Rubritalea spongiae]|uniref:LamG-like jellyroll fold domain-containing protein n=1 Tax=Rubritalea spongiae TaxID=430797 RepID=A0ABW5E8E4_9BACT